jgi:large subunit ribosomal protein L25
MDKVTVLKAQTRQHRGSKDSARLRKQGQIPAIVYGHKKEPVSISIDGHTFVEQLHHGHRLIDIELDQKQDKVLVKDVQYDYLGKEIIHVDLMRVDVTEKVTLEVPVELKGTAKGTHEGGMVELITNKLEIECLVTNIPERITISVKEMNLGDVMFAKDIALPDGVTLISSPEQLVVSCHEVAEIKTTEQLEAEMPAAPEVITAAKEETEEGEEAAEEKKEPKEKKEAKEKKE